MCFDISLENISSSNSITEEASDKKCCKKNPKIPLLGLQRIESETMCCDYRTTFHKPTKYCYTNHIIQFQPALLKNAEFAEYPSVEIEIYG